VPSRSPNRPAPARRDPKETHPDHVEPKQGMTFVLQRFRSNKGVLTEERQKIVRVIRQGDPNHGQELVWTVEYQIELEDTTGKIWKEKIIWWIMYDRFHREWADARLVQDDAAKRGEPIYAQPGREPPLGRIP
jgi:hypothetical protein